MCPSEGWTTSGELETARRTNHLSLTQRRLTALPPEIGQLTNLQQLELGGNQLTELPPEIGQLTNLRQLVIGLNELTELPPEIGQLTNLQQLHLGANQLTALPPEVGQLANLRQLELGANQLTALPPEIAQLTNLHTLHLDGNELATLPQEICQLTNLRQLYLSDNRLTTLPPEIGQLTNLHTLLLGSNGLTTLPPEIGQLTSLQQLHLNNNQLTELPPEIGQLTDLHTLRLDSNRLTTLPPEIGQLTNLRQLHLNANQLTTLPPEIGQLTNLRELYLSDNRLTTLPPEIGQLTNLRELHLDNNRLTTLPPEIGQLTNLPQLHLDNNHLTMLPPEIGQLTNLQELYLNNNQLTTLPPEIGQLTNLQQLYLRDNELTTLPRQLADLLTVGLGVVLRGNQLNEPFPELLSRGTDALVTYLQSLQDAIPQYEAKVLLVGEGNVGKTSLIAALRDAPFVEGRDTTHGIEIHSINIRHPDLDLTMTIRMWDFGGQEVYRITHQFFFSRRALYLVVWNAREGHEQDEVEAWLRRIRLRVSQDAQALVVATHCDERRPELDYPTLIRTFPQLIVGRYEVDNSSGHGIPELLYGIAIQAAQLPQMGQLISPRWIAARDEVLAQGETEPQMPYEQFVEICQRNLLEGNEILTLAELMHDLGQIVYYGTDEGLKDFVVLDPEWLTKAISYVLEDNLTKQSGGILDHARLAEIWGGQQGGPAYAARYYPYFLRLMEKFDVSYRLEDDEYRSLVAQLVPHERPDLPWDASTPLPEGIRRLALICQLTEPVPGLMAWLTVRHHRASTGKHWRTGVFLRHPIAAYASEALVELRTPIQLTVDVRAPSPDLLFNVLRDSIEDLITRRWPGLDYALFVPCPTRGSEGLSCHGQFPLKFLLGYREQGGTHAPCHECFVNWEISELLTGFAQPELSLQPQLDQLQDQVADVASGVNRLESHAAETADSMRRILGAVASEITDCPRLFTVTQENRSTLQRLRFYQRHYRVVLWCEHPGHWHPWFPASYSFDQARDWLVRIGPYATLVFKALQLVVPVAVSAAGVLLSTEQFKQAQHQLDLMKTLVADLPEQKISDEFELIGSHARQLTPAVGQAARALRVSLFEHDLTRAFGDLRRVQAPSGEFIWVCPDHYSEYDPGLPSIPGSEQ
jgi:internalin A